MNKYYKTGKRSRDMLQTHPHCMLHQKSASFQGHVLIYHCLLFTYNFISFGINLTFDPCMTFNEAINNTLKICVRFGTLDVGATERTIIKA